MFLDGLPALLRCAFVVSDTVAGQLADQGYRQYRRRLAANQLIGIRPRLAAMAPAIRPTPSPSTKQSFAGDASSDWRQHPRRHHPHGNAPPSW